jgi:NADPH-dependent glutamate synthase beta subunit-like oxidoreductase
LKRPFIVACNKVVLANGGSDLVNRLGVKGESKSLPWLKYELPLLESAIEDIKDDERSKVKPVLIVGAGLSAADAILACRNAGLPVIHVFRGVAAGFVSIHSLSPFFFILCVPKQM